MACESRTLRYQDAIIPRKSTNVFKRLVLEGGKIFVHLCKTITMNERKDNNETGTESHVKIESEKLFPSWETDPGFGFIPLAGSLDGGTAPLSEDKDGKQPEVDAQFLFWRYPFVGQIPYAWRPLPGNSEQGDLTASEYHPLCRTRSWESIAQLPQEDNHNKNARAQMELQLKRGCSSNCYNCSNAVNVTDKKNCTNDQTPKKLIVLSQNDDFVCVCLLACIAACPNWDETSLSYL